MRMSIQQKHIPLESNSHNTEKRQTHVLIQLPIQLHINQNGQKDM